MAVPLDKEQLAKSKTDYDPPENAPEAKEKKQPAVKKTPATKKSAAKKEPAAPKKGKKAAAAPPPPAPAPKKSGVGRPAAFEAVQVLTLKLPPVDVQKLKIHAIEQGVTVAQLIHNWLNLKN